MERFEGGAQIAPTAGIRSEVISHGAGTKLGVDVPAAKFFSEFCVSIPVACHYIQIKMFSFDLYC